MRMGDPGECSLFAASALFADRSGQRTLMFAQGGVFASVEAKCCLFPHFFSSFDASEDFSFRLWDNLSFYSMV